MGAQADAVFYLDPHVVQSYDPQRNSNNSDNNQCNGEDGDDSNAVNEATTRPSTNTAQYHSRVPRALAVGALAPSLLVGFYCESESSFHRLCERLEMLAQSQEPVVTVVESHGADTTSDLLLSLKPNEDPLLMSSSHEF